MLFAFQSWSLTWETTILDAEFFERFLALTGWLPQMLGFVVPQFEQLFKDMGDALPLPTRIVMGLGDAFRQYGWGIAIGFAGGGHHGAAQLAVVGDGAARHHPGGVAQDRGAARVQVGQRA